MGFLGVGHPLDWAESQSSIEYVKKHGIEQFINLYRRCAGKTGAVLRWGDEVEYFICSLDDKAQVARLPLRAPEILQELASFKELLLTSNECTKCAKAIIWHPEYANWMLEATPGQPYGENPENLLDVEANMILRRKCIQRFLLPGEGIFTLSAFPRMGCPGFTEPAHAIDAAASTISKSIYIPDEAINPHPRFPTLTSNIRLRRGEKVSMLLPVYRDERTEEALERQRAHAASHPPEAQVQLAYVRACVHALVRARVRVY